ncbi:MAG: hypothetical protein HY244_05075 [Rhizobiales bacterium]|nr:hypothetical protein [Hyphomicrobiales bacterium]
MPIPQTEEEAKKQGYEIKKLTPDEAKRIMSRGSNFALTTKTLAKDCSTIGAGNLCWEGNCVDSWKEVLYCDGTQGCTVYAKVRC